MFTHDAEYFRQRRRAQGIPARDPFSAARFQQRATEPERLEQRPWPRNLFGEVASIAELMAESAQQRNGQRAPANTDGACSCSVSKTKTKGANCTNVASDWRDSMNPAPSGL